MSAPAIVFDGVWKKFRRGERHDSLRDLIPSSVNGLLRRTRPGDLGDNDFWVLKDVSFAVRPGEALGIIGQNGAGKSTALKLLTRILKPTRGQCMVRGRLGALIEIAAGFHPDLTGRENVYLQGAIMGMHSSHIRARFDEIISFSGLESFIDTPVKRYSSGMNARLGFSIAAHLEPEVLLIDEVLAVGDFSFQQKCYARLRSFRESGVAIAFVSHNMQAVSSLCDQVILLRPAEAPLLGAPSDLTALYTFGNATRDRRATLKSPTLCSSDGAPTGAVSPGERLTFSATLQIHEPLPRSCVLFRIIRVDGQIMFSGMSTLDGHPSIDLESKQSIDITVAFYANLLRGSYRIDIALVDNQRLWDTVSLDGVAGFTVHEQNRIAGFSELSPTYTIQATMNGPANSRAEPLCNV